MAAAISKVEEERKPWTKFSAWMHGICVVTFDLEVGQAMELVYPADAKLSEQDKTSVCYLAFPDSNSGCMGDTKFHFRFRHSATGGVKLSPSYTRFNSTSPAALNAQVGYLYGYVYFRQVKDPSLPRGYFQKSLIILSRMPFVNLFLEVCSMIAPEFFDNGVESIEAACHDIDQWPFPEPGEVVNLPLLGSVLQVQIPSETSHCNVSVAPTVAAPNIIPSIHLNNVFSVLADCIHHVHLLWELVLIGEPIVVMATSPETCSQVVHALITMILPLRYAAEHRPYFTIHDAEFKEYTRANRPPPPVILGVTNPFFSKTLRHWPHVLKLERGQSLRQRIKTVSKSWSKAGVYTRYEPFLNRDKALLKKLLKGTQTNRPEEVQSALLRRHFLELTQSFMIPLERYMSTLMPLHKNISPFRSVPAPCPFNQDDFLASLTTSGPHLTTGVRGDWPGLYRRFFRSANFSTWYQERYRAITAKLHYLQLEALSNADLTTWIQNKQEVEIIDLLLKIRCKLQDSEALNLEVPQTTYHKLCKQMDDIIVTLPEDLRAVLKSNES